MAHALEIIFSFVILAISIIAVLGNLNVFEVIGPSGPSALLHFSRPQEVTIKDWKVGVVNWVITTIVVGLYVASERVAGRLQMSAFEDKIERHSHLRMGRQLGVREKSAGRPARCAVLHDAV